jgi:uncharacterized protein DUF5666
MQRMQRMPRHVRALVTAGLMLVLAVVALTAASALTHHERGRGAAALWLPAAHAQVQPGHGRMGGHGRFGVARGGRGGTITQISGTTLTLRTEQGTETVNTSGSTQYTKDRQSIAFSDLKVGDVVRVLPAAASAKPATPGTGTITASRIVVVEPMLAGRVTAIDGDTVSLVGRDGRELTVTLTDSTRYFNGAQGADRAAITVGSRVVAAGSQDSLTHLTASTVTVLPAGGGGAGPMGRGLPGRPGHLGPGGGGGFGPGGFGA